MHYALSLAYKRISLHIHTHYSPCTLRGMLKWVVSNKQALKCNGCWQATSVTDTQATLIDFQIADWCGSELKEAIYLNDVECWINTIFYSIDAQFLLYNYMFITNWNILHRYWSLLWANINNFEVSYGYLQRYSKTNQEETVFWAFWGNFTIK